MNKQKKQLREKILSIRDNLEIKVKREWDDKIFSQFIHSIYYQQAKVIFAFVSFRSEVDTHRLIKYGLEDGKTLCVPKISSKDKGIEVYKINSFEDLKIGYYGILEPGEHCDKISSQEIDLILMPGVAFDREGGRVGYGAGFYDRFLKGMEKSVEKIALAYEFQVVHKVPTDELDVKIDGVITNKEIVRVIQ